MKSKYELRPLNEDEFCKWDAFVESSNQNNIFSKSYWLKEIAKAAHCDFKVIAVFCGQEIRAGIGIVVQNKIYGKIIKSPPLTPYSSIILPDLKVIHPSRAITEIIDLTTLIATYLEDKAYSYVNVINSPKVKDIRGFIWKGWNSSPQFTYLVHLSDLNKLYGLFSKSLKRRIKKCEASEFKLYSEDNIEKFLSLYRLTFKRQNIDQPLSGDKLRDLYSSIKLHNCVKIYFIDHKNGEPISSELIVYSNKKYVHNLAAGADPKYYETNAVSYLLWHIFQDLSKQGVEYYDFNGANVEKIEQFKRSFGGELVHYFSVSKANNKLLQILKTFRDFM